MFKNSFAPVRTLCLVVALLAFSGLAHAQWGGEQQVPEDNDINAATIEPFNLIDDGHSLMPLHDWQGMFGFTISFDPGDPAPRRLSEFRYTVVGDKVDDRPWDRFNVPRTDDILEWGLFYTPPDGGNAVQELNSTSSLLMTWDAYGEPWGELVSDTPGFLRYELNFFELWNQGDWDWSDHFAEPTPEPSWPTASGDPGNTYIIAVRTTSVWRNATTMAYNFDHGVLRTNDGVIWVDEGELIDNYPGDIETPGDILGDPFIDEDVAWTSSFGAYDMTGLGRLEATEYAISDYNRWSHSRRQYTPLTGQTRFRWDVPGQVIDFVTGEWLDQRLVAPLEQWLPVVGLNLHSANPPQMGVSERSSLGIDAQEPQGQADLVEVNLILTDIGADPHGPPGNGGFNPRTGLNPFTSGALAGLPNDARSVDFVFNGANVFHDTTGTGTFEPPTQTPDSGVTLNDYPLMPYGADAIADLTDPYKPEWEYIPFPPGGGDPWWKVRLLFRGGIRRTPLDSTVEGVTGMLDPVPNVIDDLYPSSAHFDYFVVVRPDSGYQDVSLTPGDGHGLQPGADFRAFIEPRRFNEASGSYEGGIYVDSQIPFHGIPIPNEFRVADPWQDDDRWDFPNEGEPWWPERTLNQHNAKPIRTMVQVSDLVLTFSSNNRYGKITDLNYFGGTAGLGQGVRTIFDDWLDPFGLLSSRFFDNHGVGVRQSFSYTTTHFPSLPGFEPVPTETTDVFRIFQHAYETVPFFDERFDTGSRGPRSSYYAPPHMPEQPARPTYGTWLPFQDDSGDLKTGEYPRETDWPESERQARLLRQRVPAGSGDLAMLGFSFAGVDDPVTNRVQPMALEEINVAFWGEDFHPDDLRRLDSDGIAGDSGVRLFQDDDGTGMFFAEFGGDTPVPLSGLRWRDEPEPVDLTGNGQADDLNGDGVVDENDYAWVLTLRLQDPWPLPTHDRGTGGGLGTIGGGGEEEGDGGGAAATFASSLDGSDASTSPVTQIDLEAVETQLEAAAETKQLAPGGSIGDDLFLVVQTSRRAKRLQEFKAFVPASLPGRSEDEKEAGIKFTPRLNVAPGAYRKQFPEEGGVQGFYEHEMLQVDMPVRVSSLTGSSRTIEPDSGPVAILGIDMHTNRPELTLEEGNNGVGGDGTFTVEGADWAPGDLIGCYLVDHRFESYEITANTSDTLDLLSGTPRDGHYIIAKDPSFLEQVIVELYDEGGAAGFSLARDLMPLVADPEKSGIALYRDNIWHPNHRPGVFDPAIDIPLELDFRPFRAGLAGEPDNMIKMVLSTPGTSGIPLAGHEHGIENQPRRRQWAPNTNTGKFSGPDIFVVIRTSEDMDENVQFSGGIVSWGQATPTEPDSHIFPPPPTGPVDERNKFREFPWGSRALGFVTMFQEPPDRSGFNWIRTHPYYQQQTGLLQAVAAQDPDELGDVFIDAVSPTRLRQIIPDGGQDITIFGSGFGESPQVTLDGRDLSIRTAGDDEIAARIPAGTEFESEPLVLTVYNPDTRSQASRDDLFTLIEVDPDDPDDPDDALSPKITNVSPDRGGKGDFPIAIFGENFDDPLVFLETREGAAPVSTRLRVTEFSATRIDVDMPIGGLPRTGWLDMRVINQPTGEQVTASQAFEYLSDADLAWRACFVATAAYGSPLEDRLDTFRAFRDGVLLKSAAGTALVEAYYSYSPPVAEFVAGQPVAAAAARAVLTPLAWVLTYPGMSLLMLAVMAAVAVGACFFLKRRVVDTAWEGVR